MKRLLPRLLWLALLGGGLVPPPGFAASSGPITVTDLTGRQVTLQQPARRVVCLIESALSGLYMLGAEDRIVGISTNIYDSGVFPYYAAMDPRVRGRSLPTPGNWDFVNLESVVALQPDLVVIWSGQEESIKALEEKGIPVFAVFIARFSDIFREIEALGQLTGTEARATEIVGLVQNRLAEVQRRVATAADTALPRVYFMWAQGPLETSGKNSTVQELIELAGGVNAAAESPLEHLVVNLEKVLAWNPEVVVMWYNDRLGPAEVSRTAGWRALAAIRDGRVHELPDVFSCDFWTLKYLFTVELVARWCHPTRFAGTDLTALRTELFTRLYGPKLPATALPPLELGTGVAR
ncbi:MAG: ABC transporter substrate-binding protein [Candidatus Latescibacterota bacterium]|jgi:iron complex transport system substrate-binding protein